MAETVKCRCVVAINENGRCRIFDRRTMTAEQALNHAKQVVPGSPTCYWVEIEVPVPEPAATIKCSVSRAGGEG